MPRFIVGEEGSHFTVLFEDWSADSGTKWKIIACCPSREYAREICEALRFVRDESRTLL